MQILGVMVRTNNSAFTRATYRAAEEILTRSREKGHILIDLAGDMALRDNLMRVLRSIGSPRGNLLRLVAFYCAVSGDSPLDQQGMPFITENTIDAFRGWGIYCTGCYVGRYLANELVRAGATFIIAFDAPVFIPLGHEDEVIQGLNSGFLRMIEEDISPTDAADYMREYCREEGIRMLATGNSSSFDRAFCLYSLAESVGYMGSSFVLKLRGIQPGRADALDYQHLVGEILSFLFHDHLGNPHIEVETDSGVSRYDIVFYNKARQGFWHDIKIGRGNTLVIFDAKNKESLTPSDADQMLRYSSDWRGKVMFIVCRAEPSAAFHRRANEMLKEKQVCLLILTDSDFEDMLTLRKQGNDPVAVIESKYWARLECT